MTDEQATAETRYQLARCIFLRLYKDGVINDMTNTLRKCSICKGFTHSLQAGRCVLPAFSLMNDDNDADDNEWECNGVSS